MNTTNPQTGILGAKLLEEIANNGPGTAAQLAKAINEDAGFVFAKLVGLRRDGLLLPFSANRGEYTIWGLKN
jgi:hypothetical protein